MVPKTTDLGCVLETGMESLTARGRLTGWGQEVGVWVAAPSIVRVVEASKQCRGTASKQKGEVYRKVIGL